MQTTSVEQTAQNDALMDAMKKYPKLPDAQIDKYIKPFRLMSSRTKMTGSGRVVNMRCSCGWSGTKQYDKTKPFDFGENGKCPKCGTNPYKQTVNGREIDFGAQYPETLFPRKTVVYLEKASLPNDAILVRYFNVACNFKDENKDPDMLAEEVMRVFITEDDFFLFKYSANSRNVDAGPGQFFTSQQFDDSSECKWCFQSETQIRALKHLPGAKTGILDCWDVFATKHPESLYAVVGNVNTITTLQAFPGSQFFMMNGHFSIFNELSNRRWKSQTEKPQSPYEMVGCDKKMFDELAKHFPGRKLTMELISEAQSFCQKDSYNAKFFAKAKKSEYSGHVCDFVNMTGMKVEETMRLIEEVSKTFGISRENAARMLYKYVSEYEKIGIEPSFANIEHIDRDTCYAKTISNLFSKDSWYYEMRDCFFEKEVTDSITPVGCNLVDIRCRTEFPRILYNNREKEFVQRFFSEIVDIYTVFPDLYEKGAIQTVNLVMKDNVLKSIVVLAYGEVSETKDGKEVIHKAEYTS